MAKDSWVIMQNRVLECSNNNKTNEGSGYKKENVGVKLIDLFNLCNVGKTITH